MYVKSLCILTVCLLAVGSFTPILAQDTKPIYTQVGFWDVPRAKWAAYVAYFEKYEKPAMERLLADGVIVEWGFEANRLHDPDGYSHASWMSAYSLADLEKALAAYYESLGEDAARAEAELGDMVLKHADVIAESSHYGLRPAKLTGGYSIGSFVQVKPGKASDFRRAFETWSKPVLERLLADGTIVSYSMGTEHFHTDTPGGMWTWVVAETMEAHQKVEAAFDAEWEKLGQAERDARLDYRSDVIELGSHRDAFTRLIHYQTR